MVAALAWTFVPGLRPPARAANDAALAAQVRAAILANPEIIPEAMNALQSREVKRLISSNRKAIETPFAGAWTGAADADVVMVEFFDFNCPYCRQSAADVERLLADDPKLKVVFRDMPVLGPDSEQFARASLSAAEQGRYMAFYRATFAGQGALGPDRLMRVVRDAGLDEAKVAAAVDGTTFDAALQSNIALGRSLGLTGTPSYVVGDQVFSGAVGYDTLKAAIETARQRR